MLGARGSNTLGFGHGCGLFASLGWVPKKFMIDAQGGSVEEFLAKWAKKESSKDF
jgi:hypothetical protein